MSLQIRRGTEAERLSITPLTAELIYTIDTQLVYIGDGVTVGGILVGSGGGNGNYGNANVVSLLNSGLGGNIIPTVDNLYSLGNSTRQWSDLYVSNSTIYMNNVPLTANATTVLFDGVPLVSSDGTADIATTGNILAGNFIIDSGGGITFSDGSTQTTAAQPYLDSDVANFLASGTDSQNIVTTANVSASFFFGDGGLLSNTYSVANLANDLPNYSGNLNNVNNISATGNVSAYDVTATGSVFANALAVTNNSTFGGNVTAVGNVTGGNITTVGNVTAVGNVSGGNISTNGNLSVVGAASVGSLDTNLITGDSLTLQTTGTNQGINLDPNGTGNINVNNSVINNVSTPVQAGDAVNKAYVDGIASGLQIKSYVDATTTTVLPTYTYNNGAAGIGATITASSSGSLILSGVTLSTGQRVLIKNEVGSNAPYNGIYEVTDAGSVGTPFVLTRSVDDDTPALAYSAYTFDDASNTGWVCLNTATNNPIIFGTTPIEFTQFSEATSYIAGLGLNLFGQQFNVNPDNTTIAINGSNQVGVKPGAQLINPNIGNATGTSMTVTGNITAGNTTTTGTTTTNSMISNTSTVTGNSTIGGNLTVTGNTTMSNVSVPGTMVSNNVVSNTSVVNGNSTVGGNLLVTGNTVLANITSTTSTVTGNSTVGGNSTVTGSSTVGGNSTVTGSSTVGGNLSVTGNTVLANVTSTTSTVTGNSSVGGNLSVTGNTVLANVTSTTSTVTGNSAVGGNSTVTGNSAVGGNLSVTGNTVLANVTSTTSTVTGNSAVGGNSTVTGNSTVGGNIAAGGIATDNFYYANGTPITFVNKIVAGTNITISPVGGTGVVTINSSGGGTNYSNANVALYLPTYTGNLGNVTNITASGTITGNGVGLSNIAGANVSGAVGLATFATTANAVSGSNVSGAVGLATFATTANSVAGANVTGTVASATVAASANAVAGANVSGQVSFAATANAVAGANVSGAVAFATTANAVAGANVSGAVAFATTANAVAGANVSGTVASATVAASANSVAGANVSGQVANALVAGTVYTAAQLNITSVGPLVGLTVDGDTLVTGNIQVDSNVNVTGNASASYFIGDGSQLTNINYANIVDAYGNANVENYLPTYTGNLDSVSSVGGASTILFGDGANITGLPPAYVISIPAVYFDVTADGNNQTFSNSILSAYISNTDITLFYNGALLDSPYYTLSGDTITINTDLKTGDSIDVIRQFTSSAVVSTYSNSNVLAYLSSGTFAADIIPAGNNIVSLGNATNQWKDLWVSNATIYFDGLPLSVDSNNAITFNGDPLLVTGGNQNISTTGNVDAGNIIVTGDVTADYYVGNTANFSGNITASGLLTNNYYFANGQPVVFSDYGNANVANYLPTYTGNLDNVDILTANVISSNATIIANSVTLGTVASPVSVSQWTQQTIASAVPIVLMTISVTDVTHIDFNVVATDAATTSRQVSKLMAINYNGTVDYNEYGSLLIGSTVGDFTVTTNGTNIFLNVVPAVTDSVDYNVVAIVYY